MRPDPRAPGRRHLVHRSVDGPGGEHDSQVGRIFHLYLARKFLYFCGRARYKALVLRRTTRYSATDDARAHQPRSTAAPPARRGVPRSSSLRYGLMVVTAVVVIDAIVGEKGLLALMRVRQDYEAPSSRRCGRSLRKPAAARTGPPLPRRPRHHRRARPQGSRMIKPGEKLFIIRDLPPTAPR